MLQCCFGVAGFPFGSEGDVVGVVLFLEFWSFLSVCDICLPFGLFSCLCSCVWNWFDLCVFIDIVICSFRESIWVFSESV